jgi:integrase/recombinase XerD
MKNRSRLQLPFAQWPSTDQRAWTLAVTPADRFDAQGSGAHLAPSTKRVLQVSYSEYLKFISERCPTLLGKKIADRVNPALIEAFVKWLGRSRGLRGIVVTLHHLRLALQLFEPTLDLHWLLTITKRLARSAPPPVRKRNLVTSERLYQLGFTLMDRAEKQTASHANVSECSARLYRDGLIIAFLAEIPLRRRTLAALRIGENLICEEDYWRLEIAAKDTKTRQPLEFRLSQKLSARIDHYLSQFRPSIRGASKHSSIWASASGNSLSSNAIYELVCSHTQQALGVRMNPHLFRHASASFWSRQDPQNILGVKDLLGQTSFATTQRHYIPAQSRLAGRALARIIDTKRASVGAGSGRMSDCGRVGIVLRSPR